MTPASRMFCRGLILLLICHGTVAAQSTPDKQQPVKPSDESSKGSPTATPADRAASSGAIRAELVRSLQTLPVAEAQKSLESAITASPEDLPLQSLRTLLASRLMMEGDNDGAIQQLETAADTLLSHADQPANLTSLTFILESLRTYSQRTNQPQRLTPKLTAALERVRSQPRDAAEGEFLMPLARLLSLQAMVLNSDGQVAEATALLDEELNALQPLSEQPAIGERAILASVRLLQTRRQLQGNTKTPAENSSTELDELFAKGLASHPKSALIAAEYVRFRTAAAGVLAREEPEAAQRVLNDLRSRFDSTELSETPAVKAAIAMIKPMERRIETALLHREMLGKPAPAIDVAAWANGPALDLATLKGKVILLDFWAVWCGPCIATFPHLKQLHAEYHDSGLEIIGVTRQYGYQWNSETQRAAKATSEVTLDDELSMLNQFMQHHELPHRSVVTPKESQMMQQFGVSGIPHAVLIDKQGNVRMIKVGSGDDNARALHDMAKQLLAE